MPDQTQPQKPAGKPATVTMVSDITNYGDEINFGEPVEVNIRDVRTCLRAGFRPIGMTKERAKSLAEAGVVDSYRRLWDEPEPKKKAAK